jgi:hypothetical protein
MLFSDSLVEAVSAGFGGIWVKSWEHDDVVREMAEVCKKYDYKMAEFDLADGFKIIGEEKSSVADPTFNGALDACLKYANKHNDDPDFQMLLAIRNIHFCLTDAKTIQKLQRTIEKGSAIGLHIVGLSLETRKLIPELEKHFFVIDHALPTKEELYELAQEAAGDTAKLPEFGTPESDNLLSNVAGMTRIEAMGAFGISLAREGEFNPQVLWESKTQAIEKSGLLKIFKPKFGLDMVAGCDHVKDFLLSGITSKTKTKTNQLKSVLFLGVPGRGKTFIGQCLGTEVERPTIVVDVGGLKAGIVGETESNTRQATNTLDATAPSIAIIDEVEKAVSTNAMDSGASSGQLGHLLSWQNDRESEVLCIFTSNDISKLPPEFTRAGRVDGIFFFDMPSREIKDEAWALYRTHYGLDPDYELPDDENWTPAEIMQCCRLASLFGRTLKAAANMIVPVAQTNSEKINQLREWAHGRCLSADYFGIYDKNGQQEDESLKSNRPRRRIRKKETVGA